MTRYAIIMSVENYKHFTPTKFTHADSDLIYHTLTKMCDYAEQHSIILKLSPNDSKSPSEILFEIKSAVSHSTSGDSILFYFAGHGHYVDNRSYLILPDTVPDAYESTALALEDISKTLRQPERSCFRIFDACNSGIDVRNSLKQTDSQSFIRAITNEASGWVTLAACREDQYSASDPEIGHGVFTQHLCDYISKLKTDEPILPELLKVEIVNKVQEHAKRLGFDQTPVLNASISGNISLAVRRVDLRKGELQKENKEKETNLFSRISNLRSVENMLTKDRLEEVLHSLVESFNEELAGQNEMQFEITTDNPISANEIPDTMHPAIVNFAQERGIQSKHELVRRVEEHEERLHPLDRLRLYMPRKYKTVKYSISQSYDLPNSATIINLKGDNRCIPNIKVLIYVIPLQITTCMLVSSFRQGWIPCEDELRLICHSYKILRPDSKMDEVVKLASLSVKNTLEKVWEIITNRVEQLERELTEN